MRLDPLPLWWRSQAVTVCHCGMCRRWHGSLGAYVGGKPGDYQLEGEQHLRLVRLVGGRRARLLRPVRIEAVLARQGRQRDGRHGRVCWTSRPASRPPRISGSGTRATTTACRRMRPASCNLPARRRRPVDPCPPSSSEIGEASRQLPVRRYLVRVRGKMRDVVWCHCGQCLRWHGHFGGTQRAPGRTLRSAARTRSPGTNPPTRRAAASAATAAPACSGKALAETTSRSPPARSICRPASSPRVISSSRARATITGIGDGVAQSSGTMAANPVTF